MKKSDVVKMFDNRTVNNAVPTNRNYDVRVTLNKAGGNRFAIRFGFINRGFNAFKDANYLQATNVEKGQYRIYFMPHEKRDYLDVYKLSRGMASSSVYFSFTPSERAEKIYRAKWIGKTFHLGFDDECGLYFIQLNMTDFEEA